MVAELMLKNRLLKKSTIGAEEESSRNAERHQIGMLGEIIADLRATSRGSRSPLLGAREWRRPRGGKIESSPLQFENTVYAWQGAQSALICFDELTHFTAHQFFYMVSRSHSTCVRGPAERRAKHNRTRRQQPAAHEIKDSAAPGTRRPAPPPRRSSPA